MDTNIARRNEEVKDSPTPVLELLVRQDGIHKAEDLVNIDNGMCM